MAQVSVGCIVMDTIGDGGHYADGILVAMEQHGLTREQVIAAFKEEMDCTPEEAQRAHEAGEDGGDF